jgi:20S proteasome alpha/beta subunit
MPLSWNDSLFSDNTNSGFVNMANPGTISNTSITNAGGASVAVGVRYTGSGSFTLNDVRMQGTEGVDIFGSGDVYINNSYIDTTGQAGDHADGIQIYAPGTSGNLTVTNTTIVSHNQNATAGVFIADGHSGTFTFDNVVINGGPYGLRIAADAGAGHDDYVALKDVYFISNSFGYAPILFEEVNAQIHITQWDNVRWATIVNGQLIPGDLIAPPQPVEGSSAPTTPTAPAAPNIASFSTDSGVAGDKITNDNTIELKGTAAANSTIKIYDGSTQIGTAKADQAGGWDYITQVLTDAKHTLTATATNSSGQTSAASAALAITVDTKAPTAPSIASNTVNSGNQVVLSGTAEANSAIKVYDGTTQVGTATTNASGSWSVTTSALSSGTHTLTAKATDVAGNVSTASQAINSVIGTTSPPPSGSAPAAPAIASFSKDSGKAGDNITNDKTLTLTGTAVANSTVNVFDGTTKIGTATAGSNGSWSYTTSALIDGKHNFTATATNGSGTSSVSATLAVTIDASAPNAPVKNGHSVKGNQVDLTGTAEANSTVNVYDGSTLVGTTTTNATGNWAVSTSQLSSGSHSLSLTATDAAGNVSAASSTINAVIGTPTDPSASTGLVQVGNNYQLGSASGPVLKMYGAAVVAGQMYGFVPIAAVQTATGYQVAWKLAGQDQYSVWNTDTKGNYVSNVIGLASGSSSEMKSLETSFKQDLNGDGVIGLSTKTIESSGATSLVQAGDNYQLGSSGPVLKMYGAAVVAGQMYGYAPIAVEKTASGYQVAWKLAGQDQYSVWNTDNNGNYVSNAVGIASGSSSTMKSLETSFQQDLNGDGVIGLSTKTIESSGSTSLLQVGDNYQLGSSGPVLKMYGATVIAGQMYGFEPIAVEKTATGYQVAWKLAGQDQYSVWNTDNSGNYVSNAIGLASAEGSDLKALETSFHQDLNGDGKIGSSGAASPSSPSSSVDLSTMYKDSNGIVTLKGVADANSQIKVYDGNSAVGTATTAADGTWTYKTSSAVSDTVHTYTAQQINGSGQATASSGSAILGSTGSNTLKSTTGNDIFVGGGQGDTFVFAANFGRDVIKDFNPWGSAHDTIQFSKSVFDSFASVLSHATQSGSDVVISTGHDTLTLKNTQLDALSKNDFHFA